MWNVTSQRLEVVIGEVTNLKDPRGSEGKGEIFDTSCSFFNTKKWWLSTVETNSKIIKDNLRAQQMLIEIQAMRSYNSH